MGGDDGDGIGSGRNRSNSGGNGNVAVAVIVTGYVAGGDSGSTSTLGRWKEDSCEWVVFMQVSVTSGGIDVCSGNGNGSDGRDDGCSCSGSGDGIGGYDGSGS